MLRSRFYSVVGILLILAALAGLVISVAGIVGVWRVQQAVNAGLGRTLDVLETTLDATDDGLEIADQSLDQATASLDSLSGVLQTTGKTVRDSIPLFNTFAHVATEDIPAAIERTQTALDSAQSSARFIDTTLRLVTSIPFLSLERYNPEVPLSDALGEASASLDPISTSLSDLQESVATSAENLATVAEQLDAMSASIEDIQTSLAGAKEVTRKYLQVVSTLNRQLGTARENLPVRVNAIAWFLTIALAWLALTQIGLLIQGLEMLGLLIVRPSRQPR